MRYVIDPRDSGLLLAESELERYEEERIRRKKRVKYGALERSGEDFVKGCYSSIGCGCLSMIVGGGLVIGGLYWILR